MHKSFIAQGSGDINSCVFAKGKTCNIHEKANIKSVTTFFQEGKSQSIR
ncbi:MAG: hypothetical protein IT269_00850 [Saprospiraceae bacterium]|nr:hypothetical protein [Saprospiraceae bacterium]